MSATNDELWPALPYEAWKDTYATLHMWTQIVGKITVALAPPINHSWAISLHLTARGLATWNLPHGGRSFSMEFDFIDHVLVIRASDGSAERRPLGGTVAEFYQDVMRALQRMRLDVAISVLPSEVADPIPFPDDRTHQTYDARHAARFHHVLSMVDVVMKAHRARFRGRTTPVQFFWGTFDLALMRYSGRPVVPPPGAGAIARVGGDAETICAGWWPGDERIPYPAFFAYAYPAPDGIASVVIQPGVAAWNATAGEFLLAYDAARAEADPVRAILDFLGSTYAGAADLMRWDNMLTRVSAATSAGG